MHSRCDLACDHCYVYEHADQGWRRQPTRMTLDTVRAAARRIAQHAEAHGLAQVRVVLHGGEPLLLGVDGIDAVLTDLRAVISPVTDLQLRMQSNGVRLTGAFCDLFVRHGLKVGISYDGDRAANDRHRRYANGASSHDGVRRALALLRRPEYRQVYAGILCTVDIANDPIAVYEALLAEEPPAVDLLLPHATWENPPARPDGAATPYADWLLRVHRRWTADGRPVPIRLFDSIRSTGSGGHSGTEAVGLDPKDLVVVETDGSWEQVDSLKTAFDGAADTGLDVFRHSVDAAAAHPGIAQRQTRLAGLCATCRSCPVVGQCGGGLFAHRYKADTGFANPSVYCADLKELIQAMNADPVPRSAPTDDAVTADDLAAVRLLDDLATGYGDADSVAALAGAELAITRALVFEVAARAVEEHPEGLAARAWPLVVALGAGVEEVLRHPFLRGWAVACLRGTAPADQLAAVAAAAAVRGGGTTRIDIEVPVRDGAVFLPTVGTFPVLGDDSSTVLLTVEDGRVSSHPGHAALLVPLAGCDLLVEDADPYRDCFGRPVAARLDDGGRRAWAAALGGAWELIREQVPGQVPGLRAGLAAVVPLVPDPGGVLRSASARQAFGAVAGVHCPPEQLAVQLVHEFQHSKLGALLDLFDLFDPADRRGLTVGWRDDPRPVEGALQGTYAHLAVADLWRLRALRDPAAAATYVRYRRWTADAVDRLLGTGALTRAGDRLVRGMGRTIATW